MNSGMVVVLCWAAGGTAATMGGRGVSACDTMDGDTVGLPEGEMWRGRRGGEGEGELRGSSLVTRRGSLGAPINATF